MKENRFKLGCRRLLFDGPMGAVGGTTVARFQTLQTIVPETRGLDSTGACAHKNRIWNVLGHRLYCTPANLRFNIDFLRVVREFDPEVIWLEKGRWLWPWTLSRVRKSGAAIVHYNTDDLFGSGGYLWLHRLGLKQNDLYITTNRFNVSEISNRYGSTCFRAGMGHLEWTHQLSTAENVTEKEKANFADVVFVGHWEPHTEDLVSAIREAGLKIDVWGHNWKRARRPAFRKTLPLPNGDYFSTLRKSKLTLCSLSKKNRNESTGRSFDIPAIGACLFAQHTAEHAYLFRDGVEAILFKNEREMIEKAKHYCLDSVKRKRIADAGHQRCITLRLSWREHAIREWGIVERWLQKGGLELQPQEDEPFWPGFRRGTQFQEAHS